MYDVHENSFVAIEEAEVPLREKQNRIIFKTGEHVEIKGIEFVIFNVTDINIILRPVKQIKKEF